MTKSPLDGLLKVHTLAVHNDGGEIKGYRVEMIVTGRVKGTFMVDKYPDLDVCLYLANTLRDDINNNIE
jgi:hypothetical protein